jgi:hypothetical protein
MKPASSSDPNVSHDDFKEYEGKRYTGRRGHRAQTAKPAVRASLRPHA